MPHTHLLGAVIHQLDCLRHHIRACLRGREELLVRVYHEGIHRSPQPTSLSIARGQNRAYLTSKTQRSIAATPPDTPVPPVSPLDRDLVKDTARTVFLIAAYARYKCPYVWLRSNREQLLDVQLDHQTNEVDAPLRLESITHWRHRDIKLVDVIAEIVQQTMDPPPENPFAIDHSYFEQQPVEESMLLTGAMADFLQKLCLRQYAYTERVLEDLRKLQKLHFHEFDEVLAAQEQTLDEPTGGAGSAIASSASDIRGLAGVAGSVGDSFGNGSGMSGRM
ncbi:hypothetical protein THASP1DRAFT_30410 [Thamnocephalis sphaerospora]|uniref:DUF7886 domain-containing protein n=1 Tax=Thamnocephalis sphaerospora TaxID=78915 RepID=A0A4P9XP53_9FUNG|nr:hypothetical protein THASP1DRAFT_30410 [Thamnocephalis sphaerospora]|eukprot:RKP07773.1 hypothetical protein THASP1DRAFT_30410 [Thamnocephalis sphaerospora]